MGARGDRCEAFDASEDDIVSGARSMVSLHQLSFFDFSIASSIVPTM
jgi:hypothetical protein